MRRTSEDKEFLLAGEDLQVFYKFLIDCKAFKEIMDDYGIGCGDGIEEKFDKFFNDLPEDRYFSMVAYKLSIIVLSRITENKHNFLDERQKPMERTLFNLWPAEVFALMYLIKHYPPFKYGFTQLSPFEYSLIKNKIEFVFDMPQGVPYE